MSLFLIIAILSFSVLFLFFINNSFFNLIRFFSLISSSLIFLLACFIYFCFVTKSGFIQNTILFELYNSSFIFGFDGLSLFFILLTTFLCFLCFMFIWDESRFKEYAIILFTLELFLILIFTTYNLFIFYVFFEAILIPMYLLIGIWGSRERKVRAVWLFFFYTLCSSLLLLLAILYIYSIVGTFNIEYLGFYSFSFYEQIFLWLAFFLSFASKIPMFPFHIWLPEAHVEAPTIGSVLLAGILLKLGVYGLLRFNLFMFPEASFFFSPIVQILSVIGVIYASLTALRQTDLKRIIAYSSVAHMNLIVLGIFSFTLAGLEGAILQSLSHGFVSGGLFLFIGILYDRYHTRYLYYYSGLTHVMPLYSSLFLFFTLANIAFPGTSSFVGEFLILIGLFKFSKLTTIIAATSVILGGSYSLWLYNKIAFGNLKINYTLFFNDLLIREFIILLPLFILIFIGGIYPTIFSSFLYLISQNLSFIILL